MHFSKLKHGFVKVVKAVNAWVRTRSAFGNIYHLDAKKIKY